MYVAQRSLSTASKETLTDLRDPAGWQVGAEKYRQMRWNGETPLPKPGIFTSATPPIPYPTI